MSQTALTRHQRLPVTLAPNSAFDATVPDKLQAYLAAGKPAIASMNGEGARLVQVAKAGLSCPAGDARGLADGVLALYRMTPSERLPLGANGRLYAATHFDADSLVRELAAHLAGLQTIPPPKV